MTNIGELTIGVKVDKSGLTAATKEVQTEMKKTGAAIEEEVGKKGKKSFESAAAWANTFNDSLKSLGKTIFAIFAIDKVIGFGTAIVTLASNLQQAQIAFTTMLGSAEKSQKLLQDLSDFAKVTPFELVGIRENAKQLLAMGVANENLIPTMKALGDVAAGLSVPLDRLALAYGQVLAKGRLQGDDLRQFTEAGVPLLATLSANLGKTTAEISKMIEAGQISAKDVTKAFQTLSSEGGRFSDMMGKQSETLAGKFSNLKDSVTKLGETVGTRFIPSLTQVIDGMQGVVNTYGEAIGEVFASTFELIGKAYADLSQNTEKTKQDQISFGKVVLLVLNAIVSLFKSAFFVLEAFGRALAGLFVLIVQVGGEAFDTLVDASALAFNSILAFGKDFSKNFGIIFQKAVAGAIVHLNTFIDDTNNLLGTSFGKFAPVIAQSFSDSVGGGMEKAGTRVKEWADRINGYMSAIGGTFTKGVAKDWKNLQVSIVDSVGAIMRSGGEAVTVIKKIPPIDLSKILDVPGAKAGAAASKAAAQEVTYAVGKLKDAYTDLKKTQKELDDVEQKYHDANMKRLEDGYDSLRKIGDKIKDNEKAYTESLATISEKAQKESDNTTEDYVRNQAEKQVALEKSIADLDTQVQKEKEVAKLKGSEIDTAQIEKQKKLEQDIMEAKLRQSEFTNKTAQSTRVTMQDNIANLEAQLETLKSSKDFNENTQKLIDFQTERVKLEAELKDTKSNISNLTTEETKKVEDLLTVERERAALSDQKREEFDFKQRIQRIADEKKANEDAAKKKLEDDNAILDRQKAIYEFFQKRTGLTPDQLQEIQTSQQFLTASADEQILILKLANDLVALTDQKNKRIALEQEVAVETQRLSDLTTQNSIKNVQKLKKEYQDLIVEIQNAIAAQQALQTQSSTARGFAEGGYTGDGGKHEVAGNVHKGEYVVSQDMISKIPGIVPALEGVRSGNSYDQSRTVAINGPISMSEPLDFEMMIRKAKFIM